MVRNRPRLTQKASWTNEMMKAAIKAVKEDGKKLRETARYYNIPVMTLRDRLQTNNSSEAQLGRKPTFTKEQENDIAQQVLTLAKVFYGLTPTELRRLVFEYAEVNKIKHNFNISCKMAGWDWLQGFLKRNPTVSVRKPEATSLDRISAFNVEEVKLFYSNLKSVMDKHAFSSANIYNFDETGISTVQKPGNILGPKGVKQVGAATSWERGKNITICCAFSAAGTYIPPMFIFPRLRMSPLLKKDGPINAIYECSKNGWINEDLFLVWLDHFIAYAKPTKESPVLLIMDNHTTHTTLAAYNKCKDNNIVVVTIPPHTSHQLQPLDVTFYSSLKAAFARECDSFMKVNAFTKITPYDIASLFNKAYIRVANIEKGVSGFDKTGIFPLDKEKFSEEDFTVLNPNESALVSVVDEEPQKNIHEIAVTTVGQVQHEALNHSPKPSTSRQVMDVDETNPNEDLHPPKSDNASLVPFSIISPLPCPKKTSTKPNSRKQHSSIFTLTPNKIKLELAALEKEEKNKRKENNNLKETSKKVLKPKGKSKYRKSDSKLFKPKHEVTKAKKKLCRRNISFSSSEDEDKCKEIILCDDNEMDDVDLLSFGDSGAISGKELPTEAGCCLLCGEIGRDRELWFRCVFCAGWVHAECSAADSAENFVCDYCKNVS